MIVYGKSCWNRIPFIVSPFDASNVSPYLKRMQITDLLRLLH